MSTLGSWSPEQFILIGTTLISALTGAIVTILNAARQTRTQQMLVATRQDLQTNTDKTEQSVIQLQNNNRAVVRAGERIDSHTEQLQALADKLFAEHELFTQKVAQAQAVLLRLDELHVILKTAERQQLFEAELAELKALLLGMQSPPEGAQ